MCIRDRCGKIKRAASLAVPATGCKLAELFMWHLERLCTGAGNCMRPRRHQTRNVQGLVTKGGGRSARSQTPDDASKPSILSPKHLSSKSHASDGFPRQHGCPLPPQASAHGARVSLTGSVTRLPSTFEREASSQSLAGLSLIHISEPTRPY